MNCRRRPLLGFQKKPHHDHDVQGRTRSMLEARRCDQRPRTAQTGRRGGPTGKLATAHLRFPRQTKSLRVSSSDCLGLKAGRWRENSHAALHPIFLSPPLTVAAIDMPGLGRPGAKSLGTFTGERSVAFGRACTSSRRMVKWYRRRVGVPTSLTP